MACGGCVRTEHRPSAADEHSSAVPASRVAAQRGTVEECERGCAYSTRAAAVAGGAVAVKLGRQGHSARLRRQQRAAIAGRTAGIYRGAGNRQMREHMHAGEREGEGRRGREGGREGGRERGREEGGVESAPRPSLAFLLGGCFGGGVLRVWWGGLPGGVWVRVGGWRGE